MFHVSPDYQPMIREIGLDADSVFEDSRIVVWRDIPERQNCTLDVELVDGRQIRLHVKRYLPVRGKVSPAEEEARGIQLLEKEEIPTTPLVGWGSLADGRSFVITENLGAYRAADKLVERGDISFDELLDPTAKLAAHLHARNLHHRDLYLCHFFVKRSAEGVMNLRLIDAARVARLGNFLTRRRWVVKDLAQFWYSTFAAGATDEAREKWLACYGEARGLKSLAGLRRSLVRKADWIARHDVRLKARQPTRNVSIPGA